MVACRLRQSLTEPILNDQTKGELIQIQLLPLLSAKLLGLIAFERRAEGLGIATGSLSAKLDGWFTLGY
jgi:hypothetical protein